MFRKLILTFFILPISLFAIDVEEYTNNSSLQWTWAILALDEVELNGTEVILDVGCCDGKISAYMSSLVEDGAVFAIDPSDAAIQYAKKHHNRSNIAFIRGGVEMIGFKDAFDLVTAFCSLNWVDDVPQALVDLSRALADDGELLIVVPSPVDQFVKERSYNLFSTPRWKPYLSLFQKRKSYGLEEYEEMLFAAGIEPLALKKIKTPFVFADRTELENWILAIRPQFKELPKQLFKEYIDHHLSMINKSYPQAGDGRIYAFPEMLVIHGRK